MGKKFAKLDYGIDPEEVKDVDVVASTTATDNTPAEPETIIGKYITLIESALNMSHVIQFFTILFTINLEYLLFQQESRSLAPLVTTGCAAVTCLIEVIAVLKSRGQHGDAKLIDWEYGYAVLLPLITASLSRLGDATIATDTIACMVVQVSDMNVWVRVAVSMVVAVQFAVPLTVPLITALSFELVSLFVSGASVSERKLLSIGCASLAVFVDKNTDVLEIFVIRQLGGAFVAAFVASAGVYKYYSGSSDASVRFALCGAIYVVFAGVGLVVSDKLLYSTLDSTPISWIIEQSTSTPARKNLLIYWVALTAAVPVLFQLLQRVENTAVKRKAWHVLLFAAVAKSIHTEPELTSIALAIVLAVLVLVETLRSTRLPPLGETLHSILEPFTDARDRASPQVLSCAYLVLGVAAPLWINGCTNRMSSYSGLLTLGLGDTAASVVGSRFGIQQWPGGSGKTVEGTLAMAASVFAGMVGLEYTAGVPMLSGANAGVLAVGAAVFEGVLPGGANDNLWVPLFAWALLEVLLGFE